MVKEDLQRSEGQVSKIPTATYIALANYTVAGSAKADITFSNIPATYRDLVLVIQGTANTGTNIGIYPNNDSSNLSAVFAAGNGSTTSSGTLSAGQVGFLYTTIGDVTVNIMDYAVTDKHKTLLARANNAGNQVQMLAGRWASTTAITSLVLTAFGNTFSIGTTFALYGIVSQAG